MQFFMRFPPPVKLFVNDNGVMINHDTLRTPGSRRRHGAACRDRR